METKDANGKVLQDGDSVQLIKDLKVKGSTTTLKVGHVIKKIKLTDDPGAIECKEGRSTFVLKTCFLKKRK
ncbi:alkylphosphonate utilization protein [Patescibacteria group bacterium]|nr:alkylphosphonate utilization protein [Patescibacteria group bacterium]MBU1721598.1 alkylphosphonate utilization protein [Patescibacteria group bacterium]MBU1901824.1 alkylphosphonate utilization protein [Patescibacteria group bacterium]